LPAVAAEVSTEGLVCGNARGVAAMFAGRLCCISCRQKSLNKKDNGQQRKQMRQTPEIM